MAREKGREQMRKKYDLNRKEIILGSKGREREQGERKRTRGEREQWEKKERKREAREMKKKGS